MARNTILLRGDAREEARTVASAQVRPGMLVLLVGASSCRPYNVDGGQAFPVFARAQHENQGADIDDLIAVGDEATLIFPEQGAKVNAYTTETIEAGDPVTPDNAGGLRVADSGDYVIGVATADSDLGGTVGRVEIVVGALGASA